MIGLATVETQADGAVVIYEKATTTLREAQPRASRVATLDGGCVVIHGGVSVGDRVFRVEAEVSAEQEALVWSVYEAGANIHFACVLGHYLGYIADLKCENGALKLTFYVKEKLT